MEHVKRAEQARTGIQTQPSNCVIQIVSIVNIGIKLRKPTIIMDNLGRALGWGPFRGPKGYKPKTVPNH